MLLALCCAECKVECNAQQRAGIRAIAASCLKLLEELAVMVDILLSCILSRNLCHCRTYWKGGPAAEHMVYQPQLRAKSPA